MTIDVYSGALLAAALKRSTEKGCAAVVQNMLGAVAGASDVVSIHASKPVGVTISAGGLDSTLSVMRVAVGMVEGSFGMHFATEAVRAFSQTFRSLPRIIIRALPTGHLKTPQWVKFWI